MFYIFGSRLQQCILMTTAIILTVLIISLQIYWTPLARFILINNLVFKNGTYGMERFKSTQEITSLHVSITLFNVTNVDEILKSSAAVRLQEIGPFVYHEFKSKEFMVNDQDTGLITYKLRKKYTFRPDLSIGDPKSLMINWINVPIISAISNIEKLNTVKGFFARRIVNENVKKINESAFIQDTVDNFLFSGSFRQIFAELEKDAAFKSGAPVWPLLDNRFGIMYGKNNTWVANKDRAEWIFTSAAGFGKNQTYEDRDQYRLMNGSSKLPYWKSSRQCNQVGGTSGEFFSPFLTNTEPLVVYPTDICRKITFKFLEKSTLKGIETLKYTLDERSLQSGAKNPENLCYCLDPKTCKLDGLIELTDCVADDIVASGSHFYNCSPELMNRLKGMTPPNATNDQFQMLVEPNTGFPVQARAPLQINIRLKQRDGWPIISFFKESEPLILPLITITEAADIDEGQAAMLRTFLLILNPTMISLVLLGSVILLIIVITCITILIRRSAGRRSVPGRPPTERDRLLSQPGTSRKNLVPKSRSRRNSTSTTPSRSRSASRSPTRSIRSRKYT